MQSRWMREDLRASLGHRRLQNDKARAAAHTA